MFLRPHHFQLEHRFQTHVDHRNSKLDLHYNWGLYAIDIDVDALSNGRFVVRSMIARLHDGTVIAAPQDGELPWLDFKQALESNRSVTIYLALPSLSLAKANVTANRSDPAARFLVDFQELEDENTGVNPQPIQVRSLNLRLLLSTQPITGYEVIPLARVEKSAKADASPQLDATYIPPLLSCDCWLPLTAGIVQAVYDRLGKKIEVVANQVASRKITFDSQAQGDPLLLAQLCEMNYAYSRLRILGFTKGIHPFDMYLELCGLVGQLAIFGPTHRPPDLPVYDHDDLGGCFYRVKQYLDDLLNLLIEPAYRERSFVGAGMRMQVALEPTWLESVWQLYIGVLGPASPEECVKLLTQPGQLDMKIGSSDQVDNIFRLGRAGLKFEFQPMPPRLLPASTGLTYFRVNRDSNPVEWQNVQRSLTLALRLNENYIAGNVQDQRILTIKKDNKTFPMQFTLYVVPQQN